MDLSRGNIHLICSQRFFSLDLAGQPDLSDAETVLSLSGPHFMKTAALNFLYKISNFFLATYLYFFQF